MSNLPDPFNPGQPDPGPNPPAAKGPVEHAMETQQRLDLPTVPEGGELEHMQALAQQVDWPVLFIEAVPPETMKKFRALGKGKTDLERLQDLIRQVEYE